MNPLDELRDIHLPGSVSGWPPAIGWWLLAILLLVMLFTIWRYYKNTKKQRQLVNHALESLEQLEADSALDAREWLQAMSALLRRIVINLHGRKDTAGLVGKKWLDYLDGQNKKKDFSEGVGQVLVTQPYQAVAEYDRQALLALVKRWVKSQTRAGGRHA